jgi:alpha-methylacyl-CoA racemase
MHQDFERAFAAKTRDEWASLFEKTDACVAPVLDLDEARAHPHNTQRGTFIGSGQNIEPPPAPRFSRSETPLPPDTAMGERGEQALKDWGIE